MWAVVFDRPVAETWWDDAGKRGTAMWASEHETRKEIIGGCRRVGVHLPSWRRAEVTVCGEPYRPVGDRSVRPRRA